MATSFSDKLFNFFIVILFISVFIGLMQGCAHKSKKTLIFEQRTVSAYGVVVIRQYIEEGECFAYIFINSDVDESNASKFHCDNIEELKSED